MAEFEDPCVPSAEPTDLNPLRFAAGIAVLAEDAQSIPPQAAYSACKTVDAFAFAFAAAQQWDGDVAQFAPGGDFVLFDGALDTWIERYRVPLRVDVDTQEILVAAEALMAAGDHCKVRWLVDGVEYAQVAFTDAENDSRQPDVIAVADIGGAGDYVLTVELNRVDGGDTNQLIWWSARGIEIDPTNLPAPSG